MRISDWSSDVCSSDLESASAGHRAACWLLSEGAEAVAFERVAASPVATPVMAVAGDAEPLLRLEGVHLRFPVGADWLGRPQGHVHALNGVDLSIRRGETLGIVGESGCGKSTLGQVVMGLLTPSAGRVVFDGVDLWWLDPASLRSTRRRFHVAFQAHQLSLEPAMPVW